MDPETIIKEALGGKYEILSVVGKGGMATVYKAIQKSLNRIVAIKVVHHNLVHDEEFIKRFIREAQVCASLKHHNIVTVYDVGSIGTVHYMAMEFLEGETLRDRIKSRGKVSAENTIRYVLPVADALNYIHKRNLIHRDVKSSNIFITREGRSVLMDFGIVFSEEGDPLSLDGSILGTPEYMSPEQAEGKLKLDGRTDIYSLGVIMYECLTGTLPFRSENYITTLHKVIHDEVSTITTVIPRLPKWLSSVVAGCMAKDRNKRIQSGSVLVKALQNKERIRVTSSPREYATKKISRRDIPPSPTLRKGSGTPKAKSRNSSLLVLSILLAFIIVVILVWMNFGSNQKQNQRRAQGGGGQFIQQKEQVEASTSTANEDSTEINKDSDSELTQTNQNQLDEEKEPQKSEQELNEERLRALDQSVNTYLNNGDKYLANNDFDLAIVQYEQALKLAPGRSVTTNKIASAKRGKQRFIQQQAAEEETKRRQEQERQQMIQKEKQQAELERLGINMVLVRSSSLGNYYIGKTEVTQKLWKEIMDSNPSYFNYDLHPVENVSYSEIQRFIKLLNDRTGLRFRLPTEREWEFAAKGGNASKGYKYSGSNRISEVAWYEANTGKQTKRVMQQNPNELGLYDMSGNVWEWCSTKVGGSQVIKGGSWLSMNNSCATSSQEFLDPAKKDYATGFRLCR